MSNRFTVHPLFDRKGETMIAQEGEHLVTCPDPLAANLLADLLERAAHVSDVAGHLLGRGDRELGRQRIVHALAKSLGAERLQ